MAFLRFPGLQFQATPTYSDVTGDADRGVNGHADVRKWICVVGRKTMWLSAAYLCAASTPAASNEHDAKALALYEGVVMSPRTHELRSFLTRSHLQESIRRKIILTRACPSTTQNPAPASTREHCLCVVPYEISRTG